MGVLLTKSTTLITGQIAWLLGKLMDGIYNVMNGLFGIQNIGVCIIIFTVIIYTILLPLTIKQQKFSKMMSVMNPEIQALQKKYKNKKDQASMMKMQEETQLIYQKYGTSPVGGCGSMLIQFPILLGLWEVVRNIPAYVGGIYDAYKPLADGIMQTGGYQKIMEKIGSAAPIMISPKAFDYGEVNTIIDVLYKATDSTWSTLADKFPNLESLIFQTQKNVNEFNVFLGVNMAETPQAMFMNGIKTGAIAIIIAALLIPVLSGLTQWISVKLTQSTAQTTDTNNQMASQMKMMNIMFPMISVIMCFSFQAGVGIYWIVSAVVRCIQQVIVNKYLAKIPIEVFIEKNLEKAKKKNEKREVSAQALNQQAHRSVKNIEKSKMSEAERDEKLKKAAEANKNAKAGSLAAKANMVKKFNESNK